MEQITEEKFLAYEQVKGSGQTNMFDIPNVVRLAEILADVLLTEEEIRVIMNNYEVLSEKYLTKEDELI